jgi:hypothetical protein
MVLSFELPVALNNITPLVDVESLTLILRLAAGEVIKPDNDIHLILFTASSLIAAEAITVVPSHSLTNQSAGPALSLKVTVPETHHVPEVPCATLGPSK